MENIDRKCQKEKMGVYRTHYEERIGQFPEDSSDVGTRRALEVGRPRKTWRRTAEKERERVKWRSWREVSTHQLAELVRDRMLRPYLLLGERKVR